jgi:hypothetical protein
LALARERNVVTDDPESFGKLADETRVGILEAMGSLDAPASYATLFEAAGVEDRGRFNYHLRSLRGHYLAQSDSGYELTQAGRHALNALAAGRFEAPTDGELQPTDSTCGRCGSTVDVGYRTGEVVVRCPDCETTLSRFDFPARTADRLSTDELADRFGKWTRRQFALVDDGICPFCGAAMATDLKMDGEEIDAPYVVGDCRECPASLSSPLGLCLLARPDVAGALESRGIDLGVTPFWELHCCQFDAPEVENRDPLRVAVETGASGGHPPGEAVPTGAGGREPPGEAVDAGSGEGDPLRVVVDAGLDVVELRD